MEASDFLHHWRLISDATRRDLCRIALWRRRIIFTSGVESPTPHAVTCKASPSDCCVLGSDVLRLCSRISDAYKINSGAISDVMSVENSSCGLRSRISDTFPPTAKKKDNVGKWTHTCRISDKCAVGFWAQMLLCKEGKLLGHIVSVDGVKIDPKRVEAIQKLSLPRSKKDIQSFLGTINFIRRFIANFVELTKHITCMLRKNSEVRWTEEA